MIIIVSAVFSPEPVVTAMLSRDIAKELSKNNKVVVLSPPPTRPYGKKYLSLQEKKEKYEHIILDSYTCPESKIIGRVRESYDFGKKVKAYIEENRKKISLVYANTWPLFSQKIISDVLFKYNIPLILHIQDIYPESISKKIPLFGSIIEKIFLPIDKKILSNSTRVITISKKMKNYLLKTRGISSNKVDVIRNWQNDENFDKIKKDNKVKNKLFTFMYVGSINPTANVNLIINSFAELDLRNCQLLIAGDGPQKNDCIEIAKKYRDKKISFISVEPNEVAKLQSSADILILSLKKGIAKTALPSKLTAYMLSAKPILASIDLDSEVADIINKNNCGLICLPDNKIELQKQMKLFYKKDFFDLQEMGNNSYLYAKHNLTKEINLNKLINIIEYTKKKQNA
ncbi:glycosyltransferase WbuB [Malaciobacter marinus]|uniref:glycosyltransferase family 4 protein n=1 Tax=Malaciobacter marinus TaxID=505249 RepID=UPI000C07C6CD|nr:glycosyltransferase family 4 protein [Malaciobacter marinus]PHO12860.1 glycosyltransferase WbuB [Malaciobacter marinus]